MFLGYGGDKEFVVKGYVDASFDTDPDDSESQMDTYSGAVIWNSSKWAWQQHLQYDIAICKVHTDMNVADPLTKTSLTSKT